MDLNEYQRRSRGTAIYGNNLKTIDGLTYSILALAGEVGELANKLKKYHRSGTTPDKLVLADELGDCQWYLASVATELDMTLEDVAQMNLDKVDKRMAEGRVG